MNFADCLMHVDMLATPDVTYEVVLKPSNGCQSKQGVLQRVHWIGECNAGGRW